VEIVQDGQAQTGRTGFLAHFEPNERHEVRASTDSRLLLILSPWPGEGHPSRRQ
jgi:quercetin dioxygenase-like cupin family protein